MAKSAEPENGAPRTHTLTLSNRQTLHLTGIQAVNCFDEKQLILTTDEGRLTVGGSDLHVSSLLLEEGRVTVDGQIDAILYSSRGRAARKGLRGLFA